jgi:hypothetical protein
MAFLWIRENSRTKMADTNVPFDCLVEVGLIKEIRGGDLRGSFFYFVVHLSLPATPEI